MHGFHSKKAFAPVQVAEVFRDSALATGEFSLELSPLLTWPQSHDLGAAVANSDVLVAGAGIYCVVCAAGYLGERVQPPARFVSLASAVVS